VQGTSRYSEDVDEKLHSGMFDLVIRSVMLSPEDKLLIQANFLLAPDRWFGHWCCPKELLHLVAEALGRMRLLRRTSLAPPRSRSCASWRAAGFHSDRH
jgi:hypothetical protein